MKKIIAILSIACIAGLSSCSSGTLEGSAICEDVAGSFDFSWTLTNDTSDTVIIDNVELTPASTTESATRWIGKPLYPGRFLAAGSTESFYGQTIEITSHPLDYPGSPTVQTFHRECDI